MKITKEDKIWTAAVIDCEGSLGVYCWKVKGSGRFNYHAMGRIQMCNEMIPRKLEKLWGGWFSDKTYGKGNRKPYWTWSVSSNRLRYILPEILPYFLVKKEQAKLVLEYLSIAHRGHHWHDDPRIDLIRQKLARLNKKGRPPTINSDPKGILSGIK